MTLGIIHLITQEKESEEDNFKFIFKNDCK
jgi:hypothetical protein